MHYRKIAAIGLAGLTLFGAGCSSPDERQEQPYPSPYTQDTTDADVATTTPTSTLLTIPVETESTSTTTSTATSTPTSENTILPVPAAATAPASTKTFTITGNNWTFEPSAITVKKGDRVQLIVTSTDVEHGFALTAFNINRKLHPGQTETIEFTADKAGTFTFFCSVFCGSGHKSMRGTLIVQE